MSFRQIATQVKSSLIAQYFAGFFGLVFSYVIGTKVPVIASSTPCNQGALFVSQYNWNCTLANLPEWGVRLVAIFLICVVGNSIARSWSGEKSDEGLVKQMNSNNGNDTPAFINGAYILAVIIIQWRVPFVELSWVGVATFAVNLLHRWAIYSILGPIVVALFLVWRCGLWDFEQAAELAQRAHTNSFGVWVLIGLLATAFITIAI